MPLVNIGFPANANFFNFLLKDIVTFDILPFDSIRDKVFEFSESQTDPVF